MGSLRSVDLNVNYVNIGSTSTFNK